MFMFPVGIAGRPLISPTVCQEQSSARHPGEILSDFSDSQDIFCRPYHLQWLTATNGTRTVRAFASAV